MIQLLVTGKSGRMGQAVLEAASQESAVTVAATHDSGENLAAAMAQANTVIDFTIHKFTRELLDAALAKGTHLVIGTRRSGRQRRPCRSSMRRISRWG